MILNRKVLWLGKTQLKQLQSTLILEACREDLLVELIKQEAKKFNTWLVSYHFQKEGLTVAVLCIIVNEFFKVV